MGRNGCCARNLKDTLNSVEKGGIVCSTGILGGVYALNGFDPIKDILNGVYLTGFFSNYPTQQIMSDIFTFLDEHNLSPVIGAKYDLGHIRDACIALDTIVIGAGAGLSTSAGLVYKGERFKLENEEIIKAMMEQQRDMRIPSELLPVCPHCGKPLTMNLRSDSKFVEDEGWHKAAERYELFIRRHQNMRVLFLELGVGYNTPGIVKYSFWRMTAESSKTIYACVNLGEACAPTEITDRSICINADIGEVLKQL